ncbi:MAG: D-2-hydroxyacid dehydrogenase [Firmicutes bacterium]|nr:D-2-hydroxyacid dehydrogenase [Bacillota bacterium]
MKIVVLDGYTENPGDLSWEGLERFGSVTVYDRTDNSNVQEIIERIGSAEIVFTNKTLITREVIDATDIRFIGVLATGYNIVDVDYAKEKGIPVCNVPIYGTRSVSQFAIALLLEVCHHIGHHSQAVYNGDWEKNPDWCFWDYPLIELAGKIYGLMGCGNIGIHTAEIAKALGMRVIAFDARETDEALKLGVEYVSLEELFARSDVLGLQMPLFPFNTGIINKENIAKMKDGVIIINNSRGQMVVEQDLADALISGKVAAAALDVVSTEPIKGDNPLLKAPNCIITPHISWAAKESRQRIMDCSVLNLESFLKGTPVNVVNP